MTAAPSPPTLVPCYEFAGPNGTTLLAREKAILKIEGRDYDAAAEVVLRLVPRPQVVAGIVSDDPDLLIRGLKHFFGQAREPLFAFFPERPTLPEGLVTVGPSSLEKVTFLWHPLKEPVVAKGSDSTKMQRAVFHLFNGRDLYGATQSLEPLGTGGSCAVTNVALRGEGWFVCVKSLVTTRDAITSLRSDGGFGLTHVGEITRSDDSDFSGADASQILDVLRLFLSFARGHWMEPACPVGFDRQGSRVWEQWSSPRADWSGVYTWFDAHHAGQLEDLFPLFARLWMRDSWQQTLQEALYWFLNANDLRRGIDPGIILTQNALELLAFEYVVRDRGLLEAQGFKDLRASDKLRLLLASLGIPTAIPKALVNLRKLAGAKGIGWKDLPHALTEVRNSLVHPDHKQRKTATEAHHDAWLAGLWLVDLVILRLCGYTGAYSNRLTHRMVGQVVPVPWQTASPTTATSSEQP